MKTMFGMEHRYLSHLRKCLLLTRKKIRKQRRQRSKILSDFSPVCENCRFWRDCFYHMLMLVCSFAVRRCSKYQNLDSRHGLFSTVPASGEG